MTRRVKRACAASLLALATTLAPATARAVTVSDGGRCAAPSMATEPKTAISVLVRRMLFAPVADDTAFYTATLSKLFLTRGLGGGVDDAQRRQ